MPRFMCNAALEVVLSLERRQAFLQPGVDTGIQLFHVDQFGTVGPKAMEAASPRSLDRGKYSRSETYPGHGSCRVS